VDFGWKTEKLGGLNVKPELDCKDLIRWKGLFVIFETTGVFM
jgi:hypothetical protein